MIHDVPGNVFYDAAVRSMGTSWHDFFFGALEPSGTVSIDKPPLDLWLQVAATRVLGFGLVGLHLPEALGGVAACGLLFGALRRPFGLRGGAGSSARARGVAGVGADRAQRHHGLGAGGPGGRRAVAVVARPGERAHALVGAGGRGDGPGVQRQARGDAHSAPRPGVAVAVGGRARQTRVRVALATGATFLAVALSWTAIASLTPTSKRPFPIGSANGSIWHVTLVYNGLDRLSSHGATGKAEGGAGPLRLLSAGPMQYRTLIGVALLATSLLGLLALAVAARAGPLSTCGWPSATRRDGSPWGSWCGSSAGWSPSARWNAYRPATWKRSRPPSARCSGAR